MGEGIRMQGRGKGMPIWVRNRQQNGSQVKKPVPNPEFRHGKFLLCMKREWTGVKSFSIKVGR
jgi:hypothetical protein